jgi:Family of unknown function (DUF6452)
MNKKIILFNLFAIIFLISSCEKDEICIEEVTPLLIIRFYDNENPEEFKVVSNLRIEIEGIEGEFDNESVSTFTDSISIPIKVTDDLTKFKLILNGNDADDTNDNEDIFNLNYAREDLYVSRSCGFKTLFFDAKTSLESDNDNWIISIETVNNPQDILNQQSAHVKIFH